MTALERRVIDACLREREAYKVRAECVATVEAWRAAVEARDAAVNVLANAMAKRGRK